MHTRWMYPIKCAMKDLKGYIRNMSKPKGSMAKGYIIDEALGLCTKYMQKFGETRQFIWDPNEKEGVAREVLEGVPTPQTLSVQLGDAAHTYVCENHPILKPLRE